MVNRSKHKIAVKAVQKDSLFDIIRKVYERFIRIRGNPREVALGFALGVFIGMTPTMGVQTPIAIFFAALCGWSKLSAAVGVWVSNPLTAPVIYGVTYITGAKMMHLAPVFNLPLSPSWSTLKAMHDVAKLTQYLCSNISKPLFEKGTKGLAYCRLIVGYFSLINDPCHMVY